MSRSRVLLADDHPAILEGIVATLEGQYEIAGTVCNGSALVQAARTSHPDAIILDIAMPLLNGVEAAGQLKAELPGVKLLFFSMHATPAYVAAARRVGANGLVLKSAPPAELLCALEQVLSGGEYWPPAVFITHKYENGRSSSNGVSASRLSAREQEVLQMIADGRAAKEIAYQLKISVWTVTFHRQQIKKKLGLSSTADLTRYAMERGLV